MAVGTEAKQDKKGPKEVEVRPRKGPLRLKQEDQKTEGQGHWGTWTIGAQKFPTKGTKKTQEAPSKKTTKEPKGEWGGADLGPNSLRRSTPGYILNKRRVDLGSRGLRRSSPKGAPTDKENDSKVGKETQNRNVRI